MLTEIIGFYLQGLGLSVVSVGLVATFWLLRRAEAQLDKTPKDKRQIRHEVALIAALTIPILAFGFMAILLMIKA